MGGDLFGREISIGTSVLYNEIDVNEGNMTSWTTISGLGLNLAGGLFRVNLSPPDYNNGILSNYRTSKMGVNFEYNYMSTNIDSHTRIRNTMGPDEEMEQYFNSSMSQVNIVGNIGWFWRIGTNAVSPLGWCGTEIGLNWRPAIAIMIPEEGDSSSDFNWAGFSFDFAFGRSLSAAFEKLAPQPYNRFSLFILPPLTEEMGFFMALSWSRLVY